MLTKLHVHTWCTMYVHFIVKCIVAMLSSALESLWWQHQNLIIIRPYHTNEWNTVQQKALPHPMGNNYVTGRIIRKRTPTIISEKWFMRESFLRFKCFYWFLINGGISDKLILQDAHYHCHLYTKQLSRLLDRNDTHFFVLVIYQTMALPLACDQYW